MEIKNNLRKYYLIELKMEERERGALIRLLGQPSLAEDFEKSFPEYKDLNIKGLCKFLREGLKDD